jgi:Golgi apparatus protein 1
VAEITDERCRSLVKQYQALASQDVRFNVPLAEACFDDRTKLCADVPPVRAPAARSGPFPLSPSPLFAGFGGV